MNFDSNPPGATVYVIPWSDWDKNEGDELLGAYRAAVRTTTEGAPQRLEALLTTFSEFRSDLGTTPLALEVVDFESIYMAVLEDQVGRTEFYPVRGGTVSLDLP